MAFYRAIWLSVTGVLVLAGVAAAIVSPPWQGLLGLALLAVFVGPFIGAAIHPQFYENTAIPIYLLQATTVAIVGAIAAAGLIALSTVVALPHRAACRVFPTSAAKNAGPGTLVDETPTGNRGGHPGAASVPSGLPFARTAADTVLPLARRRGAVLAVAVAHQLHRPAAHRLSRSAPVPGGVAVGVAERAGPTEPSGIHPLVEQRRTRRQRPGPLLLQRPPQPALGFNSANVTTVQCDSPMTQSWRLRCCATAAAALSPGESTRLPATPLARPGIGQRH